MKKIFTLMLAFACALFVGVSCTSDSTDSTPAGGDPVEPTYAVTITVDEPAAFEAAGGPQTLNYTLSTEYAGEWLTVVESSSWLTVTAPEDQPGVLVVEALPYNVSGSPRTGSFTVAYKDAKNVTIAVSQEAAVAVFEVTWSEQSPVAATANVAILDETKQDMVWGAFTFGQSALVQNDGPMPLNTRSASMTDPAEYALGYLNDAAGPMGYGGLYLFFYYMAGYGTHLSDMMGNAVNCSLYNYGGVEEKMYIAIVGLNVNADIENYVDNTTMATSLHVYEVESLPQPKLTVKSEANATWNSGCLLLPMSVENPQENGELTITPDCDWIIGHEDAGKLHLVYEENPYAIARKAEVRVTYTYNCMVTQWGETMEMPIEVSSTVVVEQAANTTVAPLTFTLKVKESHYDHIVVDVIPSDLNATYVLNATPVEQFNMYYSGDWSKCCANDLYYVNERSYTGKLTDYKLAINTTYVDDWSYYVYAFGVDVEAQAVTGEATYVELKVVNDTPTISLDEVIEVAPGVNIVYNEDTGNYELHAPAEGGTFTVKWNVKNGVENGVIRINNTASDVVSDTYKVLVNNDTTEWWNDAEQTFTFSVNPYDAAVTQAYKHQVTIYLRYYTDATKSQSAGQAISLKVIQTAPAADPAE